MSHPARIALAYTGDFVTAVALARLVEHHQAEVITVTVDVGQGPGLSHVREKALAAGAVRAHVIDARDEFAQEFILPALQAGAQDESQDPLASALARALVARHLVRVAAMENATAVAHGCNGRGYGQLRLETAVRSLDAGLTILAPACTWGLDPAGLLAYARTHGIAPPPDPRAYVVDANLWGRSVTGGVLADPWHEPPDDVYVLTKPASQWPDVAAYVEIRFDRGVPSAINGVAMPLPELLASLETIAGAHGVGRIDRLEPCPTGPAVRVIREAPAAVVLHLAHRELQAMVVPRDLERLTHQVGRTYVDLVYNGRWFTPTREASDALVGHVQARVTGTVRVKLLKGACAVVGRTSDVGTPADAGASENADPER